MKHLGVVYDVGLRFTPEALSVPTWSPELARHDIACIANELNATAIRVEGEELPRLEEAARIAHGHGLSVLFNPWLMHATPEATRTYLEEGARVAEKLRRDGVDIVLVVGCELTIFSADIYPGSGWAERGMWMAQRLYGGGEEGKAELAEKAVLLNEALRDLAGAVRPLFAGQITYSAGLWEDVDWAPFDIIGLDFYRHGEPAEEYVATLDRHRAAGKKIIATELGSCKYEGAGKLGDGGFTCLRGANDDGSPKWADGVVPVRCEQEQADYLAEQFGLLHEAGIDGAFAFEFSKPAMPTGEGAFDMDMASFSLVKSFPAGDPRSREMPPWAPTLAYRRLGEVFKSLKAR